MRRSSPERRDTNVGIAGNVQTAARARIIGTVVAENQNEMRRLRIGLRTDD